MCVENNVKSVSIFYQIFNVLQISVYFVLRVSDMRNCNNVICSFCLCRINVFLNNLVQGGRIEGIFIITVFILKLSR